MALGSPAPQQRRALLKLAAAGMAIAVAGCVPRAAQAPVATPSVKPGPAAPRPGQPDRFGDERFFPLLRVSASMLHLPVARAHLTAAMVNDQLAAGKQMAKMAATGIATVRLPENGVGALVERLAASA